MAGILRFEIKKISSPFFSYRLQNNIFKYTTCAVIAHTFIAQRLRKNPRICCYRTTISSKNFPASPPTHCAVIAQKNLNKKHSFSRFFYLFFLVNISCNNSVCKILSSKGYKKIPSTTSNKIVCKN